MKVIDLLNKIANGEEVPNKIIYYDSILTLNEEKNNYLYEYNDEYYGNRMIHWFKLNDEVEILEEEKKIPEKLETYKENDDEDCYANILKVSKNGEYEIDEATSVIVDKINSIIDYLKSKGE